MKNTMRKKIAYALAACAVSVLMAAAPAFAHQAGTPCVEQDTDPGNSEFAQHHVVPAAHEGEVGEGGHKPGEHQGFSTCDPSGS